MPSSRRLLQITISVLALIPISSGLAGAALGPSMLDLPQPSADLDSHFRYLSGLLLAIGLAFWAMIPTIERRSAEFRLLTLVIFVGGLARLVGWVEGGLPSQPMQGALVMELVVTPLLCLWQSTLQGRSTKFGARVNTASEA